MNDFIGLRRRLFLPFLVLTLLLMLILRIMDELLGRLPKEEVEKFSKSHDYELYYMVLERYGLK